MLKRTKDKAPKQSDSETNSKTVTNE